MAQGHGETIIPVILEVRKKGDMLVRLVKLVKLPFFPDYDTDLAALIASLSIEYQNFTIDRLVSKYAPPVENDANRYKKFLVKKLALKMIVELKISHQMNSRIYEKLYSNTKVIRFDINAIKKNVSPIMVFVK